MRESSQFGLFMAPLFLAGLSLSVAAAPGAGPAGLGSVRRESEAFLKQGAIGELQGWYDVLENALGIAKEEYRPVAVFFSSPTDGWSTRMRAQVLNDEVVKTQLEHFVRVEVVVDDYPNTAGRYLVRRVPAIRILSAEGRVLNGRDGFVGAPELVRMLRGAINAEFLKKEDPEFQKLIADLENNAVGPDGWAAVMLGLGEPPKRETLRRLILKLNPFPRKEFVSMLSDARLSVRLGALETLEEIAGNSFGFDPWIGSRESPENRVALEQWSHWIEESGGEGVKAVYSVLSEEQIASSIRDIIGDNRERAVRARTMLRNSGENAAKSLQSFLAHNPEIPPAAKNRVRELFYALVMPVTGGHDPDTLAHRLIFGNLDSKLETITTLKETGRAAMPILGDFLTDPDPLIRETAADAFLSAGRAMAIPVIENHLEKETDNDVAMAVLRSIAVNEIEKGAPLVARFADHEKEDLAIMALESLGTLRAKDQAKTILEQLSDERWRVRVAALEAIGKFRESSHAGKVRSLLKDEDEFVRVAAVQTVAKLNDAGAVGALLDLYRKHEETRGPVVSALLSMKQPLPKSLKKDLAESNPDTILSVIDAVGQTRSKQLSAIEDFVHHQDLDVACAAVRLMASYGMARSDYQRTMAEILREGPPEKARSALESINLEEAQIRYFRSRLESPGQAAPGIPPLVQEIHDVFLERQKASRPEDSGDPVMGLFSAIRPYFESGENEAARHSAALLLARAGDQDAIRFLIDDTAKRTVSQRKKVAESLSDATEEALPVLINLMRDRSPDVRGAAAIAVVEHEGKREFLETFFQEIYRPGTRLKPWEVDIDYLNDSLEEGVGREIGNRFAREILESSLDTALRSFAALTMRYASKFGDEEYLMPLTESDDPFLRRAAWYAIGRTNRGVLKENLGKLVDDPSEKVRAVLPLVLDEQGQYFVHYFDEQNSQRFYDYQSSGTFRGRSRRLDDVTKEALLKLADDSSPAVRMDSALLLMTHGVKQDPAKLEATLSAFPDRDSVERRVSDYLEQRFQTLDQSFRFLTNYIDTSRIDGEDLEKIYAFFKMNPDGDGDGGYEFVERPPESRGKNSERDQAVGVEAGDFAAMDAVEVIFFHNPGCKECDRVEEYLEEMKASFPRLRVLRHNIRESESARLNEALCERFGVPQKIRMVTPAVFTGDGYLIEDEVLPVELGDLVVRSSSTGNSEAGWSALQAMEMTAAGTAIEQRYSSVGLAVILSAGILDGINPCAFATIILFLSYLQIARHGPRQILMVGLAFILAVFLTYFALGLGLVEVVTRLQFLEGVGLVLNWVLAIFVLVIMVLSFRDGILCLQGRLADTSLQLPVFLKERIRLVARTGARHHRFVIAAFLSGVVISVLELACTGQVYLPTINYMVQEGVSSAYFFLVIYNLAFVLPLVVIFILAFYGLRSEALIAFQQKHSALIKFATAGLFLALFVLLMIQVW